MLRIHLDTFFVYIHADKEYVFVHVDLRSCLLMAFALIIMALTHGVNPCVGWGSAPSAEGHYV